MLGWNEDIKKELGYCGEDVYIGQNVLFANPDKVYLGDRVRIDPFTFITAGLSTGSNVQICAYAMLGGGRSQRIILGDWTFVGYGSKLFCASEDYSGKYGPVNEFWGSNHTFRGDIFFNDYSGVASDVIVMPKVALPEGCLIGAKSFVYSSKDLETWAVYWDNPLELHKRRSKALVTSKASDSRFVKEV